MAQMRVADYIMRTIADAGVRTVFMVTGGGAMHLDDAIGQCEGLGYVCNHHEQACALAAEGYARETGGLGVAVVTSGPGGTNTITGVLGQWHDSVPVLYVSGQVRRDTTVASTATAPTTSAANLSVRHDGRLRSDRAGWLGGTCESNLSPLCSGLVPAWPARAPCAGRGWPSPWPAPRRGRGPPTRR